MKVDTSRNISAAPDFGKCKEKTRSGLSGTGKYRAGAHAVFDTAVAKSIGGASGSAGRQADAVWRG